MQRDQYLLQDMALEFHDFLLEDSWSVEDMINIEEVGTTMQQQQSVHLLHAQDVVVMRIIGAGSKLSDLVMEEEKLAPLPGSFDEMQEKVCRECLGKALRKDVTSMSYGSIMAIHFVSRV